MKNWIKKILKIEENDENKELLVYSACIYLIYKFGLQV